MASSGLGLKQCENNEYEYCSWCDNSSSEYCQCKNLETLIKGFELCKIEEPELIKPAPVGSRKNALSTEAIFENYYDGTNNTLNIDNFVYDFASYIELEVGFLLSSETVCEGALSDICDIECDECIDYTSKQYEQRLEAF